MSGRLSWMQMVQRRGIGAYLTCARDYLPSSEILYHYEQRYSREHANSVLLALFL